MAGRKSPNNDKESAGGKQTRRPRQGQLEFRGWGGRRAGSGRKPKGKRPGVRHRRRERVGERTPVHVTMRVAKGIWSLHGVAMRRVVFRKLGEARARRGARIVQFSVQANHLHLIVEAQDEAALGRAMRGLAGRLAKAINRHMKRTGAVFPDRFHSHVLRSPRQARNAVRYVRDNTKRHAAQLGMACEWELDPFAAGPCRKTFRAELRELVATSRTWLFRGAWAELARAPPG